MKILMWLALALVAFVALGVMAMFSRRASLRRELRAYLAQKHPDLTVAEETSHSLVLQRSTGEHLGTLSLHRVYRDAPEDEGSRHALYDALIASLLEGIDHLGDADRAHVLPRIVNDAFLSGARAQIRDVPALPLGVGDLWVVFVLDRKNSVAYLDRRHLSALSLDEGSALRLAKENLSRSFDAAVVRKALEEPNLNVMKALDSYDAARLLLVPDCLKPGEALAALIPDKDTLVLMPAPRAGDWSSLGKLAKAAAGEPLYPRPLLVTSTGLSVAPN